MTKQHKIMHAEFVLITPDMAREWISKNTDINRNLSRVKIDRFKAKILGGEWIDASPEPIAFDWDGHLVNGQHRLHGIVAAGKSVRALVVYDCDPESFKVIDQGNRTTGDVFTIAFKKQFGEAPVRGTLMSAVGSAMLQGLGPTPVTDKERVADATLRHHKLISHYLSEIRRTHVYSAKMTAAWCNAAVYFGRTKVDSHLNRFASSMWANERDPLKVLNERLLKAKLRESRQHMLELREHYGLALTAIRAAMLGQNRVKLEASEQEVGEADVDRKIRAAANPKALPAADQVTS